MMNVVNLVVATFLLAVHSTAALPQLSHARPVVHTAALEAPATLVIERSPPVKRASKKPAGGKSIRHVFPIQPRAHAWYGACHHDYPASDIFVPQGSHFVAVTDGVVDFVSYQDGWQPNIDDPATRGGLSVAIVGYDGVRYYGSHLSHIMSGIRAGVHVVAGQDLGLTGKTGDARRTAPHLHFGISRPTVPGDWAARRGQINPYPYLNLWRQGRNVVPDLNRPNGGVC